jgi:hypothetical protein
MRLLGKIFVAGAVIALAANLAQAERPPQKRDSATLVFEGVVDKIKSEDSKFGKDGTLTNYTVELTVKKVIKGKHDGKTITVHFFNVTKRPSKAFPGAYGHDYKLKDGDKVLVYTVKGGKTKKRNEVIYNSMGIEKLDKK